MTNKELVSLGLVLLLVGGLSGVSGGAVLSPDSQSQVPGATEQSRMPSATEHQTGAGVAALVGDGGPAAAQQGEPVNLSAVNVTALEAIDLAQERTGGKAVVVQLTRQDETPVFNVTTLHENRSISQVTVDATEATVTSVRRNITVVGTEFLGGQAFDYGELRPVGEAIRLVQNESEGTVVSAGLRRGELTYGVALRTPEGMQTQALVTATTEPILGIRTANATPPTAGTETTTPDNATTTADS